MLCRVSCSQMPRLREALRRRLARRHLAPGRGFKAGTEDLPVAAIGRLRPY